MVTTPFWSSDPQLHSHTETRLRIPGQLGWATAASTTLNVSGGRAWVPLSEGLVRDELPNQTAITSPPSDNFAYNSLIHAIEKITEYSELPDNWDGYGGVGLSRHARECALNFVILLIAQDLADAAAEVDILPVPTGGIQFEWSGHGGEIEIEIDQHGNFHSLIEHEDGSYEVSPRDKPVRQTTVLNQIKLVVG